MKSLGIICPVCGKYVFEYENDYDICHICEWENDGIQRKDWDYWGGANYESVNEAKKLFVLKNNVYTQHKVIVLIEKYRELRTQFYKEYSNIDYSQVNSNSFKEMSQKQKELHDEFSKEIDKMYMEI